LYLTSSIISPAKIGTASDIADIMQEWFESEACDGFNVMPATLPGGGDDFVDLVVPELQRRVCLAQNMRAARCAKIWA
jgi:alkanesulfonate monooxygenase SsuD/methylene tetrahydromethanopterin reductase-like flavin-dependent oxidoreductase (luciferase family)